MPLNIQDFLDPTQCPDGFVVPKLAGTVKIAFEVKPSPDPEKYGPSQSFVLSNQDGEILCTLKADDAKTVWPSPPVMQGDQVEIFSTPHGKTGAPSGNKLRSYQKQGKTNRALDVFGFRHFRNLTRNSAIQEAGISAAREATTPAAATPRTGGTPREPVFSEGEAVDAYWRIYQRMANVVVKRYSAIESFDAFMAEVDPPVLDTVHRMTSVIFLAMLDGKIKPSTERKETKP